MLKLALTFSKLHEVDTSRFVQERRHGRWRGFSHLPRANRDLGVGAAPSRRDVPGEVLRLEKLSGSWLVQRHLWTILVWLPVHAKLVAVVKEVSSGTHSNN